MSSSFIEIKGKGFWANDGFIEAMQLCLIHEIEGQSLDITDWINDYKNELALEAVPMQYGGMSLQLETYFTTAQRQGLLLQIIDSIIQKIDRSEDYITPLNLHEMRKRAMHLVAASGKLSFSNNEEFNQTVNASRWKESEEIAQVKHRYKHAFVLLKQLIRGQLQTTASSPQHYWDV